MTLQGRGLFPAGLMLYEKGKYVSISWRTSGCSLGVSLFAKGNMIVFFWLSWN
jgi:hypothetical protein